MSCLEDLLQALCPNGVEYRELGDVGKFFGGLTGKSKDDFQNGNRKFISYMNVYKNPSVDITAQDFVSINPNERQNEVNFGDILFTGSSETPEECGISSVMVQHPDVPIYLNSFTIGFRLHDSSILIPDFSKHLFRSSELRKQINKTASGVTRFNVSKARMSKVVIPIPPLPVQEEILRILDTFSGVVTELEAEQAARVRQYEHYRNELLSFDSNSEIVDKLFADFSLDSVEFTSLGEVVDILDSQRKPVTKSQRKPGPYPYYGANGIQDYVAGYIFDGTFLLLGEDGSVISPDGSPILTWATGKLWVNNHAHILAEKKNGALLRYLYYYLQTVDVSKVVRGVPPKINQENLRNIRVALPPREVQEQIVSILDRFEILVNDLKSGLPAEIALRRKQYEYYRDKLLTFQPLR